jgi:lipoprotein-releasing system permease protein
MVAWALVVVAIVAEAALIPVYEKRIERRQVVDVPLVDYGDDLPVTTIPIRPSGAMDREIGGMPKISEKVFALVDVFKSGYWEADSSHMYVDFSVAQQMAGMEGQPASDDKPAVPARTSQIQIKVRDPAQAQEVVEKIGVAWREFVKERPEAGPLQLSINTWETQQRMILTVVEMERNITALMLGLMFVGFAVLIALISYVMAYIKSRDVGILKAVGAHDAGVGSLFLGHGFIIGVIGTVLGLGGALLMIYYLDPLEVWVNTTLDVNVFPREMYYFEHIPRHISALWCVAVSGAVLVLATLASMAGGLLAALRQPVETLRYE